MPSPFDGARKVSRVPTLKGPTGAPLYRARHLPSVSRLWLATILIWIKQVRAQGYARIGHLQAEAITAGKNHFGFWLFQLLLRLPL